MRYLVSLTLTLIAAAPIANAWDANCHRMITYLALERLPNDAPTWLCSPAVHHRIAFQSNQPDRWRSWPALPLTHINDPDHYLDVEQLDQFGLSLETMPKLRREYLKALVIAKHEHPEKVDPYDAEIDPARRNEWPGFLVHSMSEQYALLQAAFNQVRILEAINDPARRQQLAQAQQIAVYHMGMLSHFVGDASQPLHTTIHYNGWVGDNPEGYTTDKTFHGYIDHGVIEHHDIRYELLRHLRSAGHKINAEDPWDNLITHVRRGNEQVEPLYRLKRDGLLDQEDGRKLICSRLVDAADMLTSLYWAAYESSAPTEEQIESWKRYNNFKPDRLPAGGKNVPTIRESAEPSAVKP
ncbi:MAG: hypothetical protein JXO22_07825 [Phycisphaerae bacterium]|nr:hypothetical protein [Phycisphaerae bacterium]